MESLWRGVRSPLFLDCVAAVLVTVMAHEEWRRRLTR